VNITDLFTPLGIPLAGGEIVGMASFTGPISPEDPQTGQSERSVFNYSHGAHAFEVAVNIETGEVKILRVAAAFDVGRAINPKIVEQQIDGGISMGTGFAFEEIIVDKGAVLNANFADYHIATTMDMPTRDNIKTMIVEVPHREGPLGAKGVGEVITVPAAPAIAHAVYNAVGVRIMDLPISREKILAGLKKEPKLVLTP
jgi:CO/xanthine dehydrogenase Mo-binding subunit